MHWIVIGEQGWGSWGSRQLLRLSSDELGRCTDIYLSSAMVRNVVTFAASAATEALLSTRTTEPVMHPILAVLCRWLTSTTSEELYIQNASSWDMFSSLWRWEGFKRGISQEFLVLRYRYRIFEVLRVHSVGFRQKRSFETYWCRILEF